MIELGSKVRDRVSGFEGIAIGTSQWLSGCDRVVIQPPAKDGVLPAAVSFDDTDVEVLATPAETGIKNYRQITIETTANGELPPKPGGPAPNVSRW